jgi:TRAP transporter TAXI family solute receptor
MKNLWSKWRSRTRQPGEISLRDLLVVALPLSLIAVAAFWAAYQFVRPAPPRSLVMTTGVEGGAYHAFALRYREILARNDIALELRTSSGSLENQQRLTDEDSGVDVGFMQGGINLQGQAPALVSLGSLYYEPLWIFYRSPSTLERLAQLKGMRIAIGPEGSGTRQLALQLLAANRIESPREKFLPVGLGDAAAAFEERRIDAAFVIAGADSRAVQKLLRLRDVRLMNLTQSEAYARLFPFLSVVTLPQGSIDLVERIPGQNTSLVATTANLIAHPDLHPALASLLLQAAREVHGRPGIFQRAGEFPMPKETDFPLSEDAKRFFQSGTPFLQRYLPFWVAVLVERMMVLLVPLIVILIPLFRVLPPLYSWRVRARVFRWYGEIKVLERDVEADLQRGAAATSLAHYHEQLDRIEEQVREVRVPLAYANEIYTLRQHIDFVRERLRKSEKPISEG